MSRKLSNVSYDILIFKGYVILGRKKRNWVSGSIYHIIVRGNHQESIFRECDDYMHFENIISEIHKRYDFDVLSYCLMTNHIHLLVQMKEEPLSKIMQLILFYYSKSHNEKYRVHGHLFEERFAAYLVEGINYLIAASRYIVSDTNKHVYLFKR